ncbi:MAG: polymer-forming cytoskeletal protein [Deltaproteobacteria bacterium]|nr:polymer-forming cytoskeletal protein [Pseudomonadota bacterium]MCK5009522.1 polymer-forming cytoskeletal protein [Deltaproteobacteria bacterium]
MKKLFKKPIQTEELTIIPENTRLEGHVEASGKVVVYGSFIGTVKCSVLEICKGGSVNAKAEVETAAIGGDFEGEMVCNGRLCITSTGTAKGRLLYRTLFVELGGSLKCSVSKLESENTKLLSFQQKQNRS